MFVTVLITPCHERRDCSLPYSFAHLVTARKFVRWERNCSRVVYVHEPCMATTWRPREQFLSLLFKIGNKWIIGKWREECCTEEEHMHTHTHTHTHTHIICVELVQNNPHGCYVLLWCPFEHTCVHVLCTYVQCSSLTVMALLHLQHRTLLYERRCWCAWQRHLAQPVSYCVCVLQIAVTGIRFALLQNVGPCCAICTGALAERRPWCDDHINVVPRLRMSGAIPLHPLPRGCENC